MANAVLDSLAQGDVDYNLVQASKEVSKDILKQDLFTKLMGMGVINTKASELIGDTAKFYNLNRVDSLGLSETDDKYANAASSVYGERTVIMDATEYSHKVKKSRTMAAIRAQTSVGDLSDGVMDIMSSFGKGVLRASLINQLAGNEATSIEVPDISATADFTTAATRARITGHNPVTAINPLYLGLGNNAAGGITNPSQITNANYLTLIDFMLMSNVLFNVNKGVTKWNGLDRSQAYGGRALALVSRTGWTQMMTAAPSADNYPSMAFELYNSISAGNDKKSDKTGKMIDGYEIHRSAFTPDICYLVVDDYELPRAVHSNAAQANTRSALILGRNAVDMKTTKLLGDAKSGIPFAILNDTTHEKLNTYDYYALYMKYGIKRTLLKGTGANASTDYDYATAKIDHYSAT
jgi:hypothetical protein